MEALKNTFSLEVELLLGRVFAAARFSRKEVEWPPHPSRLFSAMVASYKECNLGEEARSALQWLEALDPPRIYADPPLFSEGITTHRDAIKVFVPVNDDPLVPDRRNRQPRWFPSVAPDSNIVWYIWNSSSIDWDSVRWLQEIAEKVTYLGSSMSPVRIRVNLDPPNPTLEPSDFGDVNLRVMGRGRLAHLEQIYEMRNLNAYVQPRLGRVVAYARVYGKEKNIVERQMRAVSFFRIKRSDLPAESMALLSEVVKKAVMSLYPDPVPGEVSGHYSNGTPLNSPHMAVTPLLDIGHRYADGHIMGFGIWMPIGTPEQIVKSLSMVCARLEMLTMGSRGVLGLKRIRPADEESSAVSLRTVTYTKTYDTWASVTPVIFGKHPKKSKIGPGRNGGSVITDMCKLSGLPSPLEIRLGSASAFRGSPQSSQMVLQEKYSGSLVSHVWIRFDRPIQGPVLLGSGRYMGFGLLRPWYGSG